MGMTIDDHIEVLKSYNNGFTGYAGNLQNSINVAIDTMRKYQNIKQIVEHWACCGNPSDSMMAISEVVEDDKI